MISEMIKAFLLVFAAEMGDKSQIIAMTFATQFKKMDVLIGVTIAAILNHGLAIVLGRYLSKVIPLNLIQIIAGFIFIVFGLMSLKDEELEDFDAKKTFNPISTVAFAFFVGELGDKTQLTAMTLASESFYPLFILIGTSSAMVTTSALGILIGSKIGDKIPDILIKIISSIVFIIFGFIKLLDVLPARYLTPMNIWVFILLILSLEIYLVWRLTNNRKLAISPMKEVAKNLYVQTEALKKSLDSICLGNDVCGTCSGKSCLIGFIRFIIKEARENQLYYEGFTMDVDMFIKKDYDKKQIIQSLGLILADYHKFKWEDSEDFVVKKIKDGLEHLLFSSSIDETQDVDKYIKEVSKIDKKLAKLIEAEVQYNLS
ncbi:MAG: TMEM165/GDT1 family protein [Tissierellaceae bacterium]|nr:TMEM165/GDT1 family protein [Tissierellaceae bacterium]